MTPNRILLVEDDPMVLGVVRCTCEMVFESTPCVAVQSGEEAIEALAQERFDLVITDLGLPQVSGLEVVTAARDNNGSGVVVVMTGLIDDETKREVTARGAHLLRKPFGAIELETFVKRLLGARPQA
jgi:DNA-binding response OmpR family regulator